MKYFVILIDSEHRMVVISSHHDSNYRLLHASEGGIVFTARALKASAVNTIPPE